ncbi:MAG: CpsD/CapB family tyrosine-protein kinase [Phycisphaeraceae bacterium]
MGYIFDALNKKPGDSPSEPTAANESCDASPSIAQSAEGVDGSSALRLADIDLSKMIEPRKDDAAASTTTRDAERDLDFDLDDDRSMPITQPTNPKASWWSRLTGRHLRGKLDDRLVAMTSPASAMSEEYRSIRTSILARHENERHLVHTITSATPQEGKTITCVNLGLSFAELRNRDTIIIECDLRLPTFGKLLNCDTERPGLIDFLRGQAKLADVIQKVEGSPLHIIPAGGRVSDEAVQMISSQRMSGLIQGLRAKYDHVLIDTPPVLQLADAGILGSQSEEVLVVARMRRTPRPLVEQAINTLTSYNAQVSGIIATDNPRSRGKAYQYGYRYGYGYHYGYTPKASQRDAA